MSLVVETTGFEIEPLTADEAREITNKIRQNVALAWVLIEKAHKARVWVTLGYASWDAYCDAEFDGAHIVVPREERQVVLPSMRDSGMSTRAIAAATGLSQMTVVRELAKAGESNDSPADDLGAGGADDREASGPEEPSAGPADDELGLSSPPAPETTDAELVDAVFESFSTTETKDIDAATGEIIRTETTTTTKKVTGLDGKTYNAKGTTKAPKRKPLPDQIDKAGWDIRRVAERLQRLAADDRFTANKQQVAAQLTAHLSYTVEVCQDLLDQLTP